MKKSEAKRRIAELRGSFDVQFASEVLEEQSVRNNWLDQATRLAADLFGVHDDLYKRIILAQGMSDAYEEELDVEKKLVLGQKWYQTVVTWMEKMSTNIRHKTDFNKVEFQNTKKFVILFPILLVLIASYVNYHYTQKLLGTEQKFLLERIDNEDQIKLASIMAEFEYWNKGLQMGQADSMEAIAADFASRGVYQSGGHIKAVHNWALKQRFSMDSARSSYYARISSLGGDTTTLNAPRKLGMNIIRHLSELAKRLNVDDSYLRLDTL